MSKQSKRVRCSDLRFREASMFTHGLFKANCRPFTLSKTFLCPSNDPDCPTGWRLSLQVHDFSLRPNNAMHRPRRSVTGWKCEYETLQIEAEDTSMVLSYTQYPWGRITMLQTPHPVTYQLQQMNLSWDWSLHRSCNFLWCWIDIVNHLEHQLASKTSKELHAETQGEGNSGYAQQFSR